MRKLKYASNINNTDKTGLIDLNDNSIFCVCDEETANEILNKFEIPVKEEETIISKFLNTKVLPKYNCSNCKHFIGEKKEILQVNSLPEGNKSYAVECKNLTHPLEDCILRGFEGHSEQPGFSQTINT